MKVSSHKTLSLKEQIELPVPQTFPAPPMELVAFRNMTRFDREQKGAKFFAQPAVQAYLEVKWKAELYNKVEFERLQEHKAEMRDESLRDLIEEQITLFAEVIKKTDHPFRALRLDLGEHNVKPKYYKQIDMINEEVETAKRITNPTRVGESKVVMQTLQRESDGDIRP
jgi:predicted transcriptional regulator